MAEAPHPRRRTFGPVVLLGLASGGLAAYVASKPWVDGTGSDSAPGMATMAWGEVSSSPLGTALAFVAMALGSADEMRLWSRYCLDLGYIDEVRWQAWRDEYQEIAKMLQGLLRGSRRQAAASASSDI